ncbi:MAG: hypothetical protein NTZ09_02470 [Candidatus Hydrogenedentes bacterium]|nr:hypothetical protein [Candidatus Hydrogenedentota bacterium]
MRIACICVSLAVFAAALILVGGAFAQAANAASGQAAGEAVKLTMPAPAAEVTFVGRGDRAAEVGKDGNVTEFTPDKLVLRNRGKRAGVAPVPPAAAPESVKPAGPNPVEEVQKAAKDEGEKAVREALKEADVKSIEEMRKGRYMWFFDETGKVMSEEELDRRIADKDVAGIKAMNDDRDEWTPRSAKAEQK